MGAVSGHPNTRFRVLSSDGTELRAWRNGGAGPAVVMSNGLGAPPEAWPGITNFGSGFDVVGWYHRGTGGSARPEDVSRIEVEDHAEDLCAVMDAAGMTRAVLVGWSLGVNVVFEVALRHPDRVAGLLAVAGVPGGTFSGLFAPLMLPRRLRRPAGLLGAKVLARVGPVVRLVAGDLPPHELLELAALQPLGRRLRHSVAGVETLRAFSAHDWRWYSELVKAGEKHAPLDIAAVDCPVTFVAGRYDLLASSADMRAAHRLLLDSRFLELPGSHYLPLEFPEVLHRELSRLVDRSSLAPEGRADRDDPGPAPGKAFPTPQG